MVVFKEFSGSTACDKAEMVIFWKGSVLIVEIVPLCFGVFKVGGEWE